MEKGDKIAVQVSAIGQTFGPANLQNVRYRRATRVYTTNPAMPGHHPGADVRNGIIVRHRTKLPPLSVGSMLVLEFDQIDNDGDHVYKLCSKNN